MYAITTTYTNHQTGEVREYTLKTRYHTQQRAERAARGLEYVCKPDGKTLTAQCTATVRALPKGGAE